MTLNYSLAEKWTYSQISQQDVSKKTWADSLKTICTVKTIPEVLFVLEKIEAINMDKLADVNFFKANIEPMWEDPANVNGGRIIMEIPLEFKNKLASSWNNTVAFCISDKVSGICGCVFSEKANYRICIWISDPKYEAEIREGWMSIIDCPGVQFSFSLHNRYHGDSSKSRRKSYPKR